MGPKLFVFLTSCCRFHPVIMPNIRLQSSDGETFDIDVEIAKCSVTIKTMLEDLGMDEDDDEVVPLPNVNSAILRKVILWATYHKDDPPPPEDDDNKEKRTGDISSWDADFPKVDQGTLFELILAANYLDIKGLLDVTCKPVANMIKGKTPEEIRKTFNIKNDFTAGEEEQVRNANGNQLFLFVNLFPDFSNCSSSFCIIKIKAVHYFTVFGEVIDAVNSPLIRNTWKNNKISC